MTTEYGRILLTPFIDATKRDEDAFFACHFSRSEDKFAGDHNGLDAFDAMIIIKQLVHDFKIDPILLNSAFNK